MYSRNLSRLLAAIKGHRSTFITSFPVDAARNGVSAETFERYVNRARTIAAESGSELIANLVRAAWTTHPFENPTAPGRFDLEQVAARLRIPSAGQALCTDWDAAMRTPPAQALPFLQSACLAQAGREVALTDDMIGALVAFAARIAGDEDVVAYFRYCRHRVLHDATLLQSWEEPWPPLDDYLGRGAGLRRWMETDVYYQRHQRWGITPWIARWLCKHWQGKLLHLKRLQFSPSEFGGRLRAYRRRGGRELRAISEPGIRYCADGSAWGACCGDPPGAWTSTLEMTGDAVVGNPIDPNGLARRHTQRLPLDEWDQVLAPGDNVLSIHVPTGGPLAFGECGESFRRALDVFPRCFPELKFRGFSTGSRHLDPRLEALLPPESSIVRLMRNAYLYPGVQGDNRQVHQRVFGWAVTDIRNVPRRTSLQRAVGQYLDGGGHFHGGYCFLLRDDFCWGSQVYRRMMSWP